jgi:hypothetical protein
MKKILIETVDGVMIELKTPYSNEKMIGSLMLGESVEKVF